MSVTFATPVSSTTGSVSLTGVTSGQPIVLFVDFGSSPSVSDNFTTPYTWTQVAVVSETGKSGTVYKYAFIGTGGAGTSGTITLTGGGLLTAVAAIGASILSGMSAVGVYGTLASGTTYSTTASSPTMTPTTTGEGAVYSLMLVDLANDVTVSGVPSSPWVSGYVLLGSSQVGVTSTYASPPTSSLSTSWTLANPQAGYTRTLSIGVVLKAYSPPLSANLQASMVGNANETISKVLLPTANLAASMSGNIETSGGLAPTAIVPWLLPVSIDDHPYQMDFDKSQITTMQVRRQSADDSVEPGEQSLSASGVWPRAQDNYFLGAGQEFLDNRFAFESVYVHSGEYPSVRTRFWKSQGVNPWSEGKMTLLPEYASIATSSANLLIVACGNYLYKTDGAMLYWTLNPVGTASPSWTQVTTSNTNNIVSLTSDGSRVWFACASQGVFVTSAGSTTVAAAATPTGVKRDWGLARLRGGGGQHEHHELADFVSHLVRQRSGRVR